MNKVMASIVVGIISLSLAACASDAGQKETIGTLGGGLIGGLLGSQIGGGRGQMWATGAGVLLGAMAGGNIGRQLDDADRAEMRQAEQAASTAPIGKSIQWNNPRSGNYGSITPTRDGRAGNGDYCREYQQTITVGGKQQSAYGTACRQPDGSWKVVN
jgi:surface antigen